MPPAPQHFSLDKVKAFKAYFTHCRTSARGKPEFNDLDTAVKLCEQLAALMSEGQAAPKPVRKKPEAPPSNA
jgi:hypothetical protein